MRQLLIRVFLFGGVLGIVPSGVSGLMAAEPVGSTTGSGWKIDVDILHGTAYGDRYGSYSKGHVYADRQDRLWLPVSVFFPDDEPNTDAYQPLVTHIMLISDDKGLTFQVTDQKSPAPHHSRVKLADGTLIEMGTSGWIRYPRTEIKRLQKLGYYVWDLGAKSDYCAIIYDLWQKVSTDGGKTWKKREVHKQLPFFAQFVGRGPLRVLDDGTLVFLGYGYGKEDRKYNKDPKSIMWEDGRSHVYCVRSTDGGKTWKAVLAADGKFSPTPHGFRETFPIIDGEGKMFLMLRTGLGSPAFTVSSTNGGQTWSKVRQTPILAKHPLPLRLRDGSLVCSYQRRTAPPFGVRARFTKDLGQSWSEEIILRDDVPFSNALAEPNTVQFSDGTLFTAFQGLKIDDRRRPWPFIGGCRWSPNFRKPYALKLKIPKRTRKFNSKRVGP